MPAALKALPFAPLVSAAQTQLLLQMPLLLLQPPPLLCLQGRALRRVHHQPSLPPAAPPSAEAAPAKNRAAAQGHDNPHLLDSLHAQMGNARVVEKQHKAKIKAQQHAQAALGCTWVLRHSNTANYQPYSQSPQPALQQTVRRSY
jgi:hypothetical protein